MMHSGLIEDRNIDCKKIQINHLIVLCEVGEDYKFCHDLEKIIKSIGNRDLVSKVYQVMQGKLSIGSSKYKKFIEKHKHTIETMNKYSCLKKLTVLSYDVKGKRIENLAEDYFYQYIQEHKKDIETIKEVALKIKSLGFNEITFDEKLDFTKIEYELDTLYRFHFAFLENMEVNPTYLKSPIKYRTNGSCYCMILVTNGNKEVSKYDRNIELNSLIFDSNRLPKELTIESTIGVISELSEKKKAEHDDICNSVNLSISISDLKKYFENLKVVIEDINEIKDKQKLVDLLSQMKNTLTQLQLFGMNFENQIIDSHEGITVETMKKEKKLYLKRRYWENIDID